MDDPTDATPTIEGARFDHVGLAMRRATDLWPLLAGELGGRFAGQGVGEGYGWSQLRFANGFVVEGLYPESDDSPGSDNNPDFLGRFLDRSGVGPHHLTFRVPDLDLAIAALKARGLDPMGESRHDPNRFEVVIHPSQGHGIVIQLVQTTGEVVPSPADQPEGFPEPSLERPVASLGRVVHAVADLQAALNVFAHLLGGRQVSSGSAVDGNHWVELGWGGPGRLRLLEGTHAELADWLGGRPGRLRHLFFNFDEPSHVPGATSVAPGRWVVDADHVLGTRLVLASSAR